MHQLKSLFISFLLVVLIFNNAVFATTFNFTVDDNGNDSDANVGDSLCQTAGAACTLRAAFEEMNAQTNSADNAVIGFNSSMNIFPENAYVIDSEDVSGDHLNIQLDSASNTITFDGSSSVDKEFMSVKTTLEIKGDFDFQYWRESGSPGNESMFSLDEDNAKILVMMM